jgi:hypothetical protein
MKPHAPHPVSVVGNYIHATVNGSPSHRIAYGMGDGPQPEWTGNLERLVACWNACHGLNLPPDIAPGALAALVTAARDFARLQDDGRQFDLCHSVRDRFNAWNNERSAAREALAAALAPFTPHPAPPDLHRRGTL